MFLYCIFLYYIILYYIHHFTLYCIVLYCIVSYHITLRYVILYYIILYYIHHLTLYCIVSYRIIYYIILLHVIAIIHVNPENGKYFWPKHVGVLSNNKNKHIVQQVGGATCIGLVHGLHTTSHTLPSVIYERFSFTLATQLHEILGFASGADIVPYRHCG